MKSWKYRCVSISFRLCVASLALYFIASPFPRAYAMGVFANSVASVKSANVLSVSGVDQSPRHLLRSFERGHVYGNNHHRVHFALVALRCVEDCPFSTPRGV